MTLIFAKLAATPLLKYPMKAFRIIGGFSLELYVAHLVLVTMYKAGELPIPYEQGSFAGYCLILAISACAALIAHIIRSLVIKLVSKKAKQA